MVMAFFVHIVLGQENGTTVMATVKTAASRMVQAGCFIDDIFPHLNTDRKLVQRLSLFQSFASS